MTLNPNSATSNFGWKWWLQKIDVFAMSMCLLLHGVTVWAVEVVNANGPLYLFQVEHADKTVERANEMSQFFYSPLKLGDKVCILEPPDKSILSYYSDKLYLEIKLNNGEVQTIPEGGKDKSNGLYKDRCKVKVKDADAETACYCYEVKESPPQIPPTKAELLKRLLGNVVAGLSNEYDEWVLSVGKGGAEGRSTKVEMPMLGTDSTPAKIVAGRNTLHLAWEGGQSVYWVHVHREGILVQKEGFVVDKPKMDFSNPDKEPFSVGQKYKVEVIGKDDACARAEGVLKIVDDLKAILPSEEIAAIEQSEKSQQEALITALLIKNGDWLEAYQRVLSIQQKDGRTLALEKFLTDKEVRNKALLRKIQLP